MTKRTPAKTLKVEAPKDRRHQLAEQTSCDVLQWAARMVENTRGPLIYAERHDGPWGAFIVTISLRGVFRVVSASTGEVWAESRIGAPGSLARGFVPPWLRE